ncbi:MAG: PD-(D/E)XK nuclease family protein, partial [Solirubrobacterales bacterium]|nr:PD-(D/E)XK nuclease family protein [Solirubrobacterales bacterium]
RQRALAAPRLAPEGPAPLREQRLIEELLHARAWSPSSLERWLACPVRWFVERVLRPESLEPDPEPLLAGRVAHQVLRDVLAQLAEREGSARLTPPRLPAARSLLRDALARHLEETPLAAAPERAAAARRRMELDLARYLEHAARRPAPLEPTHLELGFGFDEPHSLPPLELDHGVRLRGRIDRVDLDPHGRALVVDYKRRRGVPQARWVTERNLQLALYMHAVQRLLDRPLIGGLYQPLSGDLRARGLLAGEDGTEPAEFDADLLAPAEMEERLREVLALALRAAREARSGALVSRPLTCAGGRHAGCQHPAICRFER